MPSPAATPRGLLAVFVVALLASAGAVSRSHAESRTRAAQASLQVTVGVVSACSVDSRAALSLRCASVGRVLIESGAVRSARVDETHDGLFTITTINF